MASKAPVAETASKAVYAPSEFFKFGEGASKNFGFTKHVGIALTIGIGLGFMWKVIVLLAALSLLQEAAMLWYALCWGGPRSTGVSSGLGPEPPSPSGYELRR